MKFTYKMWFVLLFFTVVFAVYCPSATQAAYSPYDVESSVLSDWWKKYGVKSDVMTNGTNLVYDVYPSKYTSGGYAVVTKDFGAGSKQYLNFQGWAILFGYKKHTSWNHETYIVAEKVAGDSGVGTLRTYKTDHIALSATEDVEYNNQGAGVWRECGENDTNKDNYLECNMQYDNVGFNAFIPMEDLFPTKLENASWKLFLVKKVDSQIVYTELKLPFTFNNKTYNDGTIDLTSGLNANSLTMLGTNVIRRTEPRQAPNSANGYFTTGGIYTRSGQNEDSTAVWYQVTDGSRWAQTAYWSFGGEQAVIKYTPAPDTDPPSHISHEFINARYVNGQDYWVQPNDQTYIRLRQYDYSGNLYQYLRFVNDSLGVDSRAQHIFSLADTTYINHWDTDPNIIINSALREENNKFGQVKWGATPMTHGHNYEIQYYYTDTQGNEVGYDNTGMKMRVDGVAPTHSWDGISNIRYQNGNVYWVRPNDAVGLKVLQYDPDSGNRYSFLRVLGSGVDVTSVHGFRNAWDNNQQIKTSTDVAITKALREDVSALGSGYGQVSFEVVPKTHGHTYDLMYYFQDNADNMFNKYVSTEKTLGVDGEAPTVQFRNDSDTSDFNGRNWDTTAVDVRLKFNDNHSGYKQSRYAWTQSTAVPTNWSAWSTDADYVVSKSTYGEWYLHVQTEDNVGNIGTTYQGVFKFNNAPVAGFELDKSEYFVGDTATITNLATDPDGNPLTYNYTITLPDGSTITETTPDFTYQFPDLPGSYTIRQDVTDSNGASDWVAVTITVNDLTIKGHVKHTTSWQERHTRSGNTPLQFYSGEIFMLEADVIAHPINRVEVDVNGNQANRNVYAKNMLLNVSTGVLYVGQLDEPQFAEGGTRLVNGNTTFVFTVYYSNGIIRSDTVTVEILGSVYDAFNFHKKY